MSDADRDADENIRTRAYLLWEASGKPDVDPSKCWHMARERIEAEHCAAYPPPQALPHHV